MQTASGIIRKEMTCGVPQESVLGPLLWNIAFDNILKEDITLVVNMICYANNILVVTAKDDIYMPKWKLNATLETMICLIKSAGPILATAKMEAVLFQADYL